MSSSRKIKKYLKNKKNNVEIVPLLNEICIESNPNEMNKLVNRLSKKPDILTELKFFIHLLKEEHRKKENAIKQRVSRRTYACVFLVLTLAVSTGNITLAILAMRLLNNYLHQPELPYLRAELQNNELLLEEHRNEIIIVERQMKDVEKKLNIIDDKFEHEFKLWDEYSRDDNCYHWREDGQQKTMPHEAHIPCWLQEHNQTHPIPKCETSAEDLCKLGKWFDTVHNQYLALRDNLDQLNKEKQSFENRVSALRDDIDSPPMRSELYVLPIVVSLIMISIVASVIYYLVKTNNVYRADLNEHDKYKADRFVTNPTHANRLINLLSRLDINSAEFEKMNYDSLLNRLQNKATQIQGKISFLSCTKFPMATNHAFLSADKSRDITKQIFEYLKPHKC